MLFGQADNDTLLGKGGADLLFGRVGNDVLTGGDGDDQMFGEAGNDRMAWNSGDDSDLMEGGAGTDTAEVNGGNGSETFTVTANGARVRFDRLAPAPFALDIGTSENLVVNMNGGDDALQRRRRPSPLSSRLTVDGGAGNDTILGSNGADLLLGGDGGLDFVDGQQGERRGSFSGPATMSFNRIPATAATSSRARRASTRSSSTEAAASEIMDISANGGTRNVLPATSAAS